MSDLEGRLQRELAVAAASIDPPPALPEELGRRVRRRRRGRAVAALTIALVALTAVAGGLVGLLGASERAESRFVTTGPERPSGDRYLDPPDLDVHLTRLPDSPLGAREDATAVWTGTELVVWGGSSGDKAAGSVTGDGAAYDPASGRWRTIAPAPIAPRTRHVAVWTGSEMIVWGGATERAGVGGLVDGAAYDPATDTWRPIADGPTERSMAEAVWLDGTMVVGGGASPAGPATTLVVYDAAADTWEQVQVGAGVQDLAAGDGSVYLATDPYDAEPVVERMDLTTRSTTALPTLPAAPSAQAQVGLGVVWTGDRLVAVSSMEGSALATWDAAAEQWVDEREVDGQLAPYVGMPTWGALGWHEGWVVSLTSSGVTIVAPATGGSEHVRSEPSSCFAGAAFAFAADAAFVFGGQNCDGDSGAGGQSPAAWIVTYRAESGDPSDPTSEEGAADPGSPVTTALRPEASPVPDGEGSLEDLDYFGFIRSLDPLARTIDVDIAQWMTGPAADAAAEDDGLIAPEEGVPNDYYVRNASDVVRTLPVADDVVVTVASCADTCNQDAGTFAGLATSFAPGSDPEPSLSDLYRGSSASYWITVRGGVVVRIDEQYRP